jgi:putative endopeptidase
MRFLRFAPLVVLLCSTASVQPASAQQAPAQQPASVTAAEKVPKVEHFDLSMVDKTLDPCQDFYKYACSKWEAANPIPPDQGYWGTGSGLRYWNENILREAMQKASAETGQRSAVEQKIGDYWAACMEETGIESAGTRDLRPQLQRISQMKNKSELADQVADLHMTLPGAWQADNNQTAAALFGFWQLQDFDDATKVVAGIDQGGLGLPNRDFYLKDDAKSREIRAKYEKHISKMLELSGESKTQAAADAKTILAIETAMARAQMDNVARRDPKNANNKMSLEQVEALTPSFNWNRYLTTVEAPHSAPHYLMISPKFFRGLEQIIHQQSVEDWKPYLRWHLVHGSTPYLSKAFVDENWEFYAHTLEGAEQQLPRWRRCVRAADRDLGEALGQAYVDIAFPPESKQRTTALTEDVERALDQDIAGLDWMQPATKEQAKVKLHAIEDKVGYPNYWRDYSSVRIAPASYLNNVHQATAFEFRRQLNKIGKPVDRSEWTMTPSTINAYYDAQLNTINFPAGILQPPYFESTMEAAVNYGAIGGVIGHEITHGFDDQGRKFDAKGNLRDWWTAEDAKAYEQRGECIASEYTQEVPEAGVKQDGHLTQGEDTADNGGTRIALIALENKLKAQGKSPDDKEADGWTPKQKFFVAYAYSWCTEVRPELVRTVVLTDPHSIPKYRVNNVVSNMPEFQQAFSCKVGTPMVRAKQCRVW